MNACELEIDLQCRGLRVDPSCTLETDARSYSRTRAGLGSGLELVIPGSRKDIWVNVPVLEPFAARSPWVLRRTAAGYRVRHGETGEEHPVRVPPEPRWYRARTSAGTEMNRVGVLQGTYLGIYIEETCAFWTSSPSLQCAFCTSGLNVGTAEEPRKTVADVVETALAAKEESGVTFVHFNSGFQGERDIDGVGPFVKALKERVGVLVGVQMTPSRHLWKYRWLRDLGVDHLSFCYEFHNPEYFSRLLPGKQKVFGQKAFYDAMETAARLWGPGRVSGEIIAGIEPLEDTLAAIDHIVSIGAFPTVCIFRPLKGAQMEDAPPPRPEEMRVVFRRVAEACRRAGLPVGLAPNIEVSLVVQPDDALELLNPWDPRTWLYRAKLRALRTAAGPLLRRALEPHPVAAPDAPVRPAGASA
jgi:hypothetical protein